MCEVGLKYNDRLMRYWRMLRGCYADATCNFAFFKGLWFAYLWTKLDQTRGEGRGPLPHQVVQPWSLCGQVYGHSGPGKTAAFTVF